MNKKVVQRIKEYICKIFGHSFDDIEMIMFKIKVTALNSERLDKSIKCKRCGFVYREGIMVDLTNNGGW